ncbi:MAG TPA: hypothetical protein VKQ30_09750 [Ktedonobacterales bacterium]|nr:hypothetical protein [Ktedonobacterales bacterium]
MLPENRLDALLSRELAGMQLPAALPGDDALEPLLVAAGALRPLREARPSTAFANALEERLLAHVSTMAAATERNVASDGATAAYPIAPSTTLPSRTTRRAPAAHRPRFLWPAVAAAVLLLAFGTLTAAASAGPGSLLYSLHRLEQGVRVALSGSAADRMRLHLGYASDALNVTNGAARTGDTTSFSDALSTLRYEMAAAAGELRDIPPGAEHDSLAAQLTALSDRAVVGLSADLPLLSWANRLATTDALASFGDNVLRVTSATAQRTQNPSAHIWHIVVIGSGFAPGAQLLVNGRPAGIVTAVSNTTLTADYTASDGQPPETIGVANADDTAAQTERVAFMTPAQGGTPGPAVGPAVTPGDHSGGSGKGGHGGDHGGTPTPSPATGG